MICPAMSVTMLEGMPNPIILCEVIPLLAGGRKRRDAHDLVGQQAHESPAAVAGVDGRRRLEHISKVALGPPK